jgi:hypothetical protein
MLTYGQEEYKKHFSNVLRDGIIDSTFVFNTSKNEDTTVEASLTYLGISKKGFKVMYATETYPASATRHGFRGLFIVDTKGNRYWYRDIDQPEKMKDGLLYFKHVDRDNKPYYHTADLNKEIPKFLCVDKEDSDCYDYQTHM